MNTQTKVKAKFFSETLGLSPLKTRIKQSKLIFTGKKHVPSSSFDLSSIGHLKPSVSIPLWLGKYKIKNKVIISNLYNHTPTPIEDGWSVKKTQTKDFRHRKLTYDSHNATDFAIPINSTLLAAAPGKVVLIKSEFNRGGLKIVIDHGKGLLSCSVHLARALVKVGQEVKRGEPIAITGYSGFDGFITCPFGIPHVHFNTWHNSIPVDPFANGEEEESIWVGENNLPEPIEKIKNEVFNVSPVNPANLEKVISTCLDKELAEQLNNIESTHLRACHVVFEMAYYPTLFPQKLNVWKQDFSREKRLKLIRVKIKVRFFMDNTIEHRKPFANSKNNLLRYRRIAKHI
ncbi:M23 family metallopeptidase [Bacteriovoracaceae bacterium]|nr:M23 family metallopeptidase [Bacteriovoracaceae bacterium]